MIVLTALVYALIVAAMGPLIVLGIVWVGNLVLDSLDRRALRHE